MKEQVGLLVFSYGTPQTEADIMPYYTSIRHGYAPTQAEIDVLSRRYEAIGGLSPLAAITKRQAEQLAMQVNERLSGVDYQLFVGNKHIAPFIEDAVDQMGQAGIQKAVAIITAPYFSSFTTQAYFDRTNRKAKKYGLAIQQVPAWNEEERFLQYWADALLHTRKTLPEFARVKVVFTAHSLPYHVIFMGDTYPEAVKKTAQRIASLANVSDYSLAWQSAGVRGDWLTPDVETVTKEIEASDYEAVIYVPIGFVADHLEILYDNDIKCRALCNELGLRYRRVPMPNDDPFFIEAMTDAVEKVVTKEKA